MKTIYHQLIRTFLRFTRIDIMINKKDMRSPQNIVLQYPHPHSRKKQPVSYTHLTLPTTPDV